MVKGNVGIDDGVGNVGDGYGVMVATVLLVATVQVAAVMVATWVVIHSRWVFGNLTETRNLWL